MTALTPDEYRELTAPTAFLDYETDAVQGFIDDAVKDRSADPGQLATELYYAVRDDIFYEVYGADLSRDGLKASHTVTVKQGFCLHKSALFAAACRGVGVPARVVYGDVRNHLASDRLREHIGGDTFFHGLNSVHLNGTWIKATPVFNKILCRLYGMQALEFDGTSDSLYHPFDDQGHASMEFLADHGSFDDVPYDFVMSHMRSKHPNFLDSSGTGTVRGGSLADESDRSHD
ncbi:transglutaminase domain-containing protein [Streptomyces sp. NA04227]|uniref:transglutaminase-like domain-containing protein n=1 Tax=Streptomyces sp. NA04227 TaxID=2742136 RepID=UPI001590CBC7|nr:transglutaminase domain-containing protein [Streptomyces sp. NA04227]QKW05257.1 transglutaminase domain-containing protein [Streptomyces sp. NA04227]